MFGIKRIRVRSYEKGLTFKHREFKRLLEPGVHWFFDPLSRIEVAVSDRRAPSVEHPGIDLVVVANVLGKDAEVVQLKARERALVWVDGRLDRVINDGKIHVFWATHRKVKVEIFDAARLRFEHPLLCDVLAHPLGRLTLETVAVPEKHAGVYFRNGQYMQTLNAGTHAFWKQEDRFQVVSVSLAEQSLDISGQDIMTSDKVTLRVNAGVAFRVTDPERFVRVAEDARQVLYREVQLCLRALVGTNTLDDLLADKASMADRMRDEVSGRAQSLGIALISVGLRDVILPGDMKALLNRVTEAKKAAEANLIVRREETAAMRSQANTAKLMENNPVLMRLRELELLEKISTNSRLSVMLGEKGLRERVVNLL